MKKFKKVIAVLAALLIVSRIVLMGVSAAMVGAGVMVGIVAILAAALVASGQYTEAQVDNMSRNEIVWSVKNGIDNGTIDPKKKFPNPDKNTVGTLSTLSLVDAFTNSEVYNNWKDGVDIIENAMDDWLEKWYQAWNNDYANEEDFVKPVLSGNIDMHGYGAVAVFETERVVYYYYSDYIVIDPSDFYDDGNGYLKYKYTRYGNIVQYNDWSKYDSSISSWSSSFYGSSTDRFDDRYKFYGDVRYEDGTQAPTNDEYEYPLGETEDGTKVTVDMLNPDATVTVDGVTEKPSDYINIEYYTDPAVIDLLQQILNALDNANVAAPDDTKDIVDEIEGTVSIDVPEELTDYVVPTGISSVFPFCIPIDVYRGFKLLSRPAVAPKFEIPFKIPAFGLFEGYEDKVVLDFSKYDEYIKIFRWFQIIGFAFLLCSVTFKLVKGA